MQHIKIAIFQRIATFKNSVEIRDLQEANDFLKTKKPADIISVQFDTTSTKLNNGEIVAITTVMITYYETV